VAGLRAVNGIVWAAVLPAGGLSGCIEGRVVGNPLVAQPVSSTTAVSGVWVLEDAQGLKSSIESGDWASAVLGAAGTAMDALAFVEDPFGSILAAGVGWLMEHVGPLKHALDSLAGNPEVIAAHSQTWKNIAQELGSIGTDLASQVNTDLSGWSGPGADAYRQQAGNAADLLNAASQACEGASSGVQTAGQVVASVRQLVRDAIAQVVGHMVSWALQVIATLGIGLAWVVPQVVQLVARTATHIADLVKNLTTALKTLTTLFKKTGGVFDDASSGLKNLKPGSSATPGKVDSLPSGPSNVDPASGSTTPSSTGHLPPSNPPADVSPPPKLDNTDTTTPSSATGNGGTPSPSDAGGADTTTPSRTSGGDTSPPSVVPSDSGGLNGDTPKDASGSPNKPGQPRDRAVGSDSRVCESDPVDVATGEMVLEQTDLVLPAPLQLILRRTHVSSYRAGRWFGPSWASTVDQRLEVDDEDACYFSPDGMILVYPLPAPGTTGLPVEGPRLPLTRHLDGGYTIEDPVRRRRLRFERVPGAQPGLLPLTSISGGYARIEVDHDPAGAPRSIRHSDGYHVEISTAAGRITSIAVLDQRAGAGVSVVRYGYNAERRLSQVINSSARPMLFDYDTHGRITGWQDRNGTWYRYVYDAAGRCVRTVGDKGFRDGTFGYDRERMVTTYTDSLGFRTEYHLNEANQVVRQVDPLGNVTLSTWDRHDRLLSRTDPLGRTTSYEYDAAGALRRLTRPDGSLVQLDIRDGAVAAISVRDGDRTWWRGYGDAGPDPFGGQVGVAAGFRYETLASDGAYAVGGADAADTAKAADPSRYTPDMFGRPAIVTTPAGGRVQLGWTVEGLRAFRVGPTGGREQWSYDPEGNEITHVDEAGGITRQEFGPFDVVVARTDPTGARTTYAYDTELRLTTVTNPLGLTWSYVHDPAGQVTEERDFDGRTLEFEYDAAGRLIRTINGVGERTEYVHDTLGNVVERRTPFGVTTFSYDPVGRLTKAANGDAVLEYERDQWGRVTAETVNGRTMTFEYDPEGRWIRRRTPSGADSFWSFTETGAPLSLTSGGHVLRFGRDNMGREVQRSLDGKAVLTQSFDAEQRLVTQEAAGRQRRFDYRSDGHLVRTMDTVCGTVLFQLDPTGRVVEVTAPDRRESYRYDVAGNITSSAEAGRWPVAAESGTRGYSGNTLKAAGAVSYQHDLQGRVVLRRLADQFGERIWRYSWDAQDRMTGVTTPDGTHWRYRYDPLGRRIAKQRLAQGQAVAEQVDFVWDGGKVVEQIRRGADGRSQVLTWDYAPDDDAPVTQLETGGPARLFHTVVTDAVGKPTDLVGAGGAPDWHGLSTAWGKELRAGSTTAGTPLRFPGQYSDNETGLHYNVYRYYDPATGRYISQDPLGLAPAPNPVAYVRNPYRVADPLGLAPGSCSQSGNLGVADRPGGGDDAARLDDTASAPNPREGTPEPESMDITDVAAASPDPSLNPATPGYVFHGSGAPPSVVFQQGLTSDAMRQGVNPIYDIAKHQHRSYGSGSGYVSTSGNYNTGMQFVPIKPGAEQSAGANWRGQGATTYHGRDGYVYVVKPSDGMVHLPSQPDRVPTFDGQDEWAAKDHIPGSQIHGAYHITGNYNVQPFGNPGEPPKIIPMPTSNIKSQFIPNPDFVE
jgi:RHS repeat-associated protein